MEYQIIEDWRNWAKTGVMPKRPHCTLNQSRNAPSLSIFFSDEDLLRFDQRIAALSRNHPLSVKIFKMRYLSGLTYSKIGEVLNMTPQKAKKAADNVISKALNVI